MTGRSAKPLEYGVNEMPPPYQLAIFSLQHVMLMFSTVGMTILFADQIKGSTEFTANMVMISMLAAGIGSIIQSIGLPFIGSGYLCPSLCGPSYLSLCMTAAWTGGMPLVRGMIFLAGMLEVVLAPMLKQLRNIFPPYIVGLVVSMVGVSIIKMSVISFFGLDFRDDLVRNENIIVGIVTLMVTVLCNIWGKGLVRICCLLIGVIAGLTVSLFILPEYLYSFSKIGHYALFALPSIDTERIKISFHPDMILPFVIVSISGMLKTFGNLLAAQKASEPDLKDVHYSPIIKGIVADGFSTALAGLLGGMAVDTSSSNVGLAGNTKVLSRWISVGAGTIFIIIALCPKITAAMSLMPKPVLGSSLIFAGSYMICAGFEQMFSKEWHLRKTFVAGISLCFGLSTALLPELYARTPILVQTIFTDPLPTTTILAVFLNILINFDQTVIALRKKARLGIKS
jgi:xanthine permease XanP